METLTFLTIIASRAGTSCFFLSLKNMASSFLDATLSAPPGAQQVASKEGLPLEIASASNVPQRIIPLLVHDVAVHTHARQKMYISLFSDSLNDFLNYCSAPTDDMELLLVMLFSLAQRRAGLSPMQTRFNVDISDMCFSMLHSLLAVPSQPQFPQCLAALRQLLLRLDCTMDRLYCRGECAPPPCVEPFLPPSFSDEDMKTLESSRVESSAPATPLTAASIDNVDALFYSLDCLPDSIRRGLCETDFVAMETWFGNLARESPGGPALVVEGMSQSSRIGSKYACSVVRDALSTLFPTGAASLLDVVHFFFPFTPIDVIVRRASGLKLAEPTAVTDASPNYLAAARTVFVEPQLEQVSTTLFTMQRTGNFEFNAESVQAVMDWFDALDCACCGDHRC